MQRSGAVCFRVVSLCVASFLLLSAASLRAQNRISNLPLPEHVTQGSGSLVLARGLRISFEGFTEPRLERARDRFLMQLSRETGILRWPKSLPNQPRFVIHTERASEPVQQLGEDESYRLQVTPEQVVLSAPTPLGILHGLQTFLQLVQVSDHGFVVPALTIEDKPRFPWRGLMIDSGRHFIPLDVLRQNLDLMEATKLNVFHWHLSEDQGFRVESKIYPLLQGEGSDGQYYTQDQVRDLIAYAHDRGIRVVPEFDMPGHAGAWFVGYPQLASGPGPYSIERKWGIFDPAMDPSRASTYEFLDRLLGEMTELFPDAYFHIGGDECNGKEWDTNPQIQSFMRAHELKSDAALQAYFTGRVQTLVTKHHKITVGWDEVLQPDTPSDVVIQSWRGQDSLAVAARQGNRGILSWGYYLDLNEPARQHYAVDPQGGHAADLTSAQQKLILGGEAAMWSEYMTPEIITGRIWPRAAAVAERLWSPQDVTEPASMYQRLGLFSQRLPWYGLPPGEINQALVQRMIGGADPTPLLLLASVMEPPKEYVRESLRDYDAYTPLNRLVDAVPAESEQGREFNQLAARIAAGHGSAADFAQARQRLTLWRDNDAALQPLLARSSLTLELAPVSLNLSHAAAIGLDALTSLRDRKPASEAVQRQQFAALKKMEVPEAVLVDTVVPGVELLVRASSN
jgi:hexosaminidase